MASTRPTGDSRLVAFLAIATTALVLGEYLDSRRVDPWLLLVVAGLVPLACAVSLTSRTNRLGLGVGTPRKGLIALAIGFPIALGCGATLGWLTGTHLGAAATPSASHVASSWIPRILSVEIAFRSALLFGLLTWLSPSVAAAVSVLPYALVHLDKPWPEPAGAIAVGYGLSFCALYTGSIWYGSALHLVGALAVYGVRT